MSLTISHDAQGGAVQYLSLVRNAVQESLDIRRAAELAGAAEFIERLPMEHQAVFMVDAYARLGVKIVTHPAYTKWVQANKSMVFS